MLLEEAHTDGVVLVDDAFHASRLTFAFEHSESTAREERVHHCVARLTGRRRRGRRWGSCSLLFAGATLRAARAGRVRRRGRGGDGLQQPPVEREATRVRVQIAVEPRADQQCAARRHQRALHLHECKLHISLLWSRLLRLLLLVSCVALSLSVLLLRLRRRRIARLRLVDELRQVLVVAVELEAASGRHCSLGTRTRRRRRRGRGRLLVDWKWQRSPEEQHSAHAGLVPESNVELRTRLDTLLVEAHFMHVHQRRLRSSEARALRSSDRIIKQLTSAIK